MEDGVLTAWEEENEGARRIDTARINLQQCIRSTEYGAITFATFRADPGYEHSNELFSSCLGAAAQLCGP